MRTSFTKAAALMLTVVVVYALLTLPASPERLPVTRPATIVNGAYHVHTSRSDGSGSVDEVARAAASADLQFVIITDHHTLSNIRAVPAPPSYQHGVLVIDGLEVSTREGHVVALGLTSRLPYPLGGEARDVIDDVHRLGGWTVAAHPHSPKRELRWRGGRTDAVEWINADSERRLHGPLRLLQAGAHAIFRPAPAIARLFSRPEATIELWDRWGRQAHTSGLAAVDAHARIGLDDGDEPQTSRTLLRQPSYAAMFRSLVQSVWLTAPLTGEAASDAAQILDALRTGRTYSAVPALAHPALLHVVTDRGTLRASVEGAPDAVVSILRNGSVVASSPASTEAEATDAGSYRVEVQWPGADVPWMMSAPVQIPGGDGRQERAGEPAAPQPTVAVVGPWGVEHHPATTASAQADPLGATFTFALARGSAPGQYAALVSPLDASRSLSEVAFTVVADRPMRFSVQVRLPPTGSSTEGERWVRSVYADETSRAVRLRLEDFEPAGRPTSRRPIAARAQSLLFVVDAPNTPPGVHGTIHVSNVVVSGPPDDTIRFEP